MYISYPKLTIVTVTYNAETYLEATIQSVLSQDYTEVEYIIIDGASTDGTLEIIKKYESHLAYWVSEPDRGIYDAMNKGIQAASGEWINMMNAGDVFSASTVLSQIVNALEPQTEVIYGGVNFIYPEAGKCVYDSPREPETIYTKLPCSHQSLFVKTLLARRFLYNEAYKLSSDVELFFQLVQNQAVFKVVDIPICNFLMGGKSQHDRVISHMEVLEIALRFFPRSEDIYRHTSFTALLNANPYFDETSNYAFSLQFNKLIRQLEDLKKRHSRIVLYGYGHFGHVAKSILDKNIAFIVDRSSDAPHVFSPERLTKNDFDVVLITVLGREKEITDTLIALGVASEKIECFRC